MLLFNLPSFIGRTILSDHKFGNAATKSFDNKTWHKINAQINWVAATNTSWASIGSSDAREHLLFDESSPIIEDLKTYAIDQCKQLKGNIPAILSEVNRIVNALTSQPGLSRHEVEAGLDKRLNDYIVDKKRLMNTTLSPVITMDELLQNKLLVCRHKGPLAACILAELVRNNVLPAGTVRQYRSQIQHGTHIGVHTWAVYRDKQSNDLWMCDPRWDYVENVAHNAMQAAAKGYGTVAINKMITRLNTLDQAEFNRLHALSESPDLEDSSYDEEYDRDLDENSDTENQAEALLNALRQQQLLTPTRTRVAAALPQPECELDFLNDDLNAVYDRIERENSPMRQFMKNIGKSISSKGARRIQAIQDLEFILLEMHNNRQLSNIEKAVTIYAHFHRVQLGIRNERNRFQSSLDVLCSSYKRKILNLYKNDVNQICRLYGLEDVRRDNLITDPVTRRQICRV